MVRTRVPRPLRVERQPDLLSAEFWNCLTVAFWAELGQQPWSTTTGSASGKKLIMESACGLSVPTEHWPSPASGSPVDKWGPKDARSRAPHQPQRQPPPYCGGQRKLCSRTHSASPLGHSEAQA